MEKNGEKMKKRNKWNKETNEKGHYTSIQSTLKLKVLFQYFQFQSRP